MSHLHAHFAEPLNIETLAGYAHMSASTFHEHFKRCTLLSPVQYLKRLRLLKAQQLLLVEGMGVAQAAHNVGYQSTSQFSREYKRYFERNPGKSARLSSNVAGQNRSGWPTWSGRSAARPDWWATSVPAVHCASPRNVRPGTECH